MNERWEKIDRCGKTDLDVLECSLDDALFLFALRKIQNTPQNDLKEVWVSNTKRWKRRLPADGFEYLRLECARLATTTIVNTKENPQQLTLQPHGGS